MFGVVYVVLGDQRLVQEGVNILLGMLSGSGSRCRLGRCPPDWRTNLMMYYLDMRSALIVDQEYRLKNPCVDWARGFEPLISYIANRTISQ